MMIRITKGGFKMVPEGEQVLTVKSVKALPAARPQVIEFEWVHADGGTIKESFKTSVPKAMEILGKRCDIALDGKLPEGTEISENDLPDIFNGKSFTAFVVHNHVKGNDGNERTFANIKYLINLVGDTDEVSKEGAEEEKKEEEEDDL
jgi:hypothetical protein